MKFPIALTPILEETLLRFGLKENAVRYEALAHWEEIVGDRVASVAIPERIKDHCLIVRVQSSVWKYELTMRTSEILEKIHTFTGSQELKEIHWR